MQGMTALLELACLEWLWAAAQPPRAGRKGGGVLLLALSVSCRARCAAVMLALLLPPPPCIMATCCPKHKNPNRYQEVDLRYVVAFESPARALQWCLLVQVRNADAAQGIFLHTSLPGCTTTMLCCPRNT